MDEMPAPPEGEELVKPESDQPETNGVPTEEALTPETGSELPAEKELQPEPTDGTEPNEPVVSEHIVTDETVPRHRRIPKKKLLVALVIVLNLGLGGANAYEWTRPAKSQASEADTTSKLANATPPKTTTIKVTTSSGTADLTSLHYVSNPLKLEFDYPVDWRISSSSDNTSIDMTSAPFNFTDAEGHAALSNIDITISSVNTTNDAFSFMSDSDTIQADSEALTYSNPTTVQRKQTNLSFAGSGSEVSGQINNMFVSGNNVYSKGELVGSKDYKKVDPHINLLISPCAGVHCEGLVEAPFTADDWHTNPQLLKAKAVIESLRLN